MLLVVPELKNRERNRWSGRLQDILGGDVLADRLHEACLELFDPYVQKSSEMQFLAAELEVHGIRVKPADPGEAEVQEDTPAALLEWAGPLLGWQRNVEAQSCQMS